MHHVKEPVVFGDNDAVAFGVSLRFNEIDSVCDFFASREVVVRPVLVGAAHDVRAFEFHGVGIFGRDEHHRVFEVLDGGRMVRVLVRDENFSDLVGPVAEFRKGFGVVL